jgi:hypothetical protein
LYRFHVFSFCIQAAFYTNGVQLTVLIPPLVPPNVVLTNSVCMTRSFSLVSGLHLGDIDCGEAAGNAVCYDSESNALWAYHPISQRLRKWSNTGPSPKLIRVHPSSMTCLVLLLFSLLL